MDSPAAPRTLLLGTISLDRYLASGEVLPGGGILNMAIAWRRLGRPFQLLTRIGREDGDAIAEFLAANDIAAAAAADLRAEGSSSSIDIEIQADRQPWMDHFVGGVWDDYRLTPGERHVLAGAERLHVVLVEGAIAELARLADDGALGRRAVSADFLGFRHYTVDRLRETMGHVDLGFIGWPGAPEDPTVAGIRDVAVELGRRIVVTMGSREVRVFDGRGLGEPVERRFPVTPVAVAGTTLGCGDAFIAWFLDELWRSGDIERAMGRGMDGGAEATRWLHPLPDDVYPSLAANVAASRP